MLDPLATVALLSERVGEPIEDEADQKLANAMLRSASAQVRHHGLSHWTARDDDLPSNAQANTVAPDIAIEITLNAAARGYLNPAHYITERADSATLMRFDTGAGDPSALTDYEVNMLKTFKPSAKGLASALTVNSDVWRKSGPGQCDRSCYRQFSHYATPMPFECRRGCVE